MEPYKTGDRVVYLWKKKTVHGQVFSVENMTDSEYLVVIRVHDHYYRKIGLCYLRFLSRKLNPSHV